MTEPLTVREYEKISLGDSTAQGNGDSVPICREDFDFLLNLDSLESGGILGGYDGEYDQKPPRIVRHVDNKTLQIQHYVGVVRLPSETMLEILPKVQITENLADEKQKVIDMITRAVSPKISAHTNAPESGSLMDYMIWCFLGVMDDVLRRGIKQDYVLQQENCSFIKGKILFNQHIRHNAVLQHRTYCEYQDFTADCVENRILHTALQCCVRHAVDGGVKQRAIKFCHMFDGIGTMDSRQDFDRWTNNRYYAHYTNIRPWAEIIINGTQPFMSQGKQSVPAVLFPMEIVFEKYVAWCLEQYSDGYSIRTQGTGKKLTTDNFKLEPDIVAKKGDTTTILDTKWKRYKEQGIKRDDAFQMFAYSTAYKGADTVLLYPLDHRNKQQPNTEQQKFQYGGGTLKTQLVDLNQTPKKIAESVLKFDKSPL